LVKIDKKKLLLVKNVKILTSFFGPMPISEGEHPNFLKIWQLTNFDMGFLKNKLEVKKKVDF
jgi:hypothetical protein